MSRKRRNLLSKKRKHSKRNNKRSTKTRKNMRKMRGGATTIRNMEHPVGSYFIVEGIDENNVYGLLNNGIYKVVAITPNTFVVVHVNENGLPLNGENNLVINVNDLNDDRNQFVLENYFPMPVRGVEEDDF